MAGEMPIDFGQTLIPTALGFGSLAALGAFLAVYIIVMLAIYIYTAIALMAIAKKTDTPNGWLAWIPIANIYLMTQIAGISGWWTFGLLIVIIPFIGYFALLAGMIFLYWRIAIKLDKPGWWGILAMIPIVGWIIIGIMAWGK
jgi:uncharacterized membrane protein YhaH (DUF805 family)